MISLESNGNEIFFGRNTVLSRLEAEPLRYEASPAYGDGFDTSPLPRRLKIEGYIIADSDDPEEGRQEISRRRDMLSVITSPHGEFTVRIGERRGVLTDGELTILREAPFSGRAAERFTLAANIRGGFFTGERISADCMAVSDGTAFPLVADDGGTVVGRHTGETVITAANRGDLAVGFTGSFTVGDTVTEFRLCNTTTGEFIRCGRSFAAGDVIQVSTLADGLYLRLVRGGQTYSLAGYADPSSRMFTLAPGENRITVGSGAAVSGMITYEEAYVSF